MKNISLERGAKKMNSEIKTKEAPAAIGPYSQGIIAGEFAFVSG